LNFFLPISERGIRFPSFVVNAAGSNNTLDGKPVLLVPHASSSSQSQFSNPVRYNSASSHHTSLLKRNIQKSGNSMTTTATIGGGRSNEELDEDLNDTDSYSISNEPTSMRLPHRPLSFCLERTENLKKIDVFLQMINELLLLPFSNPSIHTTVATISQMQSPKHYYNNMSPSSSHRAHHQQHRTSFSKTNSPPSPLKYNDSTKQSLANMEIVFSLSMIVKHSHLFANAFASEAFANNPYSVDTG
jgi:hypothetical protein